MTENMKKLLEQISKNEALCEKAHNADKALLIALTKEMNIELSGADFEQTCELSDDELAAVAGGGRCICSFGGGGENADGSIRCMHHRRRRQLVTAFQSFQQSFSIDAFPFKAEIHKVTQTQQACPLNSEMACAVEMRIMNFFTLVQTLILPHCAV